MLPAEYSSAFRTFPCHGITSVTRFLSIVLHPCGNQHGQTLRKTNEVLLTGIKYLKPLVLDMALLYHSFISIYVLCISLSPHIGAKIIPDDPIMVAVLIFPFISNILITSFLSGLHTPGEILTLTPLPAADFKSDASACSATYTYYTPHEI